MLELVRNLVLQSTVFLAGFLFLMAAVLLAEKTLHNAFDRYRRCRYRLYEDILLLEFAREPPIVHAGPRGPGEGAAAGSGAPS